MSNSYLKYKKQYIALKYGGGTTDLNIGLYTIPNNTIIRFTKENTFQLVSSDKQNNTPDKNGSTNMLKLDTLYKIPKETGLKPVGNNEFGVVSIIQKKITETKKPIDAPKNAPITIGNIFTSALTNVSKVGKNIVTSASKVGKDLITSAKKITKV